MYNSMNSPSQLTGWTSSGGDPCGQSWKGITCSGSRVTQIKITNLGLTGSIGHGYYFLEDVYPRMTPSFIMALFAEEPVVMAHPEMFVLHRHLWKSSIKIKQRLDS